MTFQPPSMNLRYGTGTEASEQNRQALSDGRQNASQIPDFEEITRKYPDFKGALSVYAAGSVIQGWSHANSDLDLYVITEDRITVDPQLAIFERRVSTTDPVIHIVLGEFGPFRADIELWRASQVDEIIGRFAGRTPDQEAPELEKSEQDLLYRLASGRPVHGADWWQERRDAINGSGYGLWLAENRKLTAETFLEDVAGLLISQDDETAILAAHEAFVGALEAVLAVNGDYSINRKWLYRRLTAFTPAQISVEDAWATITMTGATEDPRGWAERTARTAQRLLLAVEEKAA